MKNEHPRHQDISKHLIYIGSQTNQQIDSRRKMERGRFTKIFRRQEW